MEANGGRGSNSSSTRARWTEARRRKEPTLYDEWLNEEKVEQKTVTQSPRRQSMPLRHGDTAAFAVSTTAATIRPVTPEDAVDYLGDNENSMEEQNAMEPERGTTSFERTFIPRTTTTIVGGPAALSAASLPYSAPPKSRKLMKERGWEKEARLASHSPPSSRNGSNNSGMLARASSKTNGNSSNGHLPHVASMGERDVSGSARRRTRTLEESRRERSPTDTQAKNRSRVGSVNVQGAEYLASVPAPIAPPSAPSLRSFSPVQLIEDANAAVRKSTSRASSHAADSIKSNQSGTRKIWYLMNTLKGRTSGHVSLRRDWDTPWTDLFCYIKEDTGRLGYESPGSENGHRTLVRTLKGCTVKPHAEGETLYLEVTVPQSDTKLHLKLLTQPDFDSWLAALLWWQEQHSTPSQQPVARPPSATSVGTSSRPEIIPPRTSSARGQRDRADSSKSDRRKSVVSSKEAPVIKIGKMIYWDTNIGYSNAPGSGAVGQPATGRPQAYRVQSFGSRRWKRISGQLRENGELKLHSDADNSLISVVQLSQLSRAAIQRLDPSVLENEFCTAIYPQYTSNSTNTQPGFIRPIFLSLESRVLFEVWFVLLRAFTIPQLYGPPIATNATSLDNEHEEAARNPDLENMLATTTTDMFRMERTMSVRIVEAKMFPTPTTSAAQDPGFSGGHSRGAQMANNKPEMHGYYAEVLLDNETRGKTVVKFDGLTPLWSENFEFLDLPPVLSSASVVIKRRPPNGAHAREKQESRLIHEAYGLTDDQHGGYSGLTFDVVCGKVEIVLQELEEEKEVEKWWPIVNMYNQRVGEVLIKTRIDEGVILMQRDYRSLSELLHRFTNGLTIQIAQMVPGELKRVSDCLLNIFQVSGKVSDWISALVEEEIDGIHKETPISKLRYSRRIGSDASHDALGTGGANTDRELIVRDLNKNATLEANLLFRGNTLLTKSLDTHMRRVGKEYLEVSLGAKMREINEKEPDCEVDPSRVSSPQQLDANWKRLLTITQEVWKSIVAAKPHCPVELRVIFRHIRACAEDRYGDFLRSVPYSSVSGFLFLRFFCPAVLNPKLFGLLSEDVKPRARRTFTLIAKSLQTMSNMASFGAKETWMEPMNAFLIQNRESFKSFIDDVCYVPTPLSASVHSGTPAQSPTYPPGVVSAETHLSYTTPMTIMQRLPPTSREGFPSLPYLLDQARAFAELVQLWLEATTAMSGGTETTASAKSHAEVMAAIRASDGDLVSFHDICTRLHKRTQECLNRAERAERPNSAVSFHWEELIDQLQPNQHTDSGDEIYTPPASALDAMAETVAGDPSIVPSSSHSGHHREWDVTHEDVEDDDFGTRLYDTTPPHSASIAAFDFGSGNRPGSSGLVNSLQSSLRRAQAHSRQSNSPSHSIPASASASNVSSAVSSDTEHPTALPKFTRDKDHQERREAAKQRIQQQVETAARQREEDKEKRRQKPSVVSALRKKNKRIGEATSSSQGSLWSQGYASHG